MERSNEAKTIQVRRDTKLKLDGLGAKGETYDQIIKRLIAFYEKCNATTQAAVDSLLRN